MGGASVALTPLNAAVDERFHDARARVGVLARQSCQFQALLLMHPEQTFVLVHLLA